MSSIDESSAQSRRRRSSAWSDQFCSWQPIRRSAADDPLPVGPRQTESNAFIHHGEDTLSPPCFNYYPLQIFLDRASLSEVTDLNRHPLLTKLCLIDDRAFPEDLEERHGASGNESATNQDRYVRGRFTNERQPDGVFRSALNERTLYYRLSQGVRKI
jgi:hypothetical protein